MSFIAVALACLLVIGLLERRRHQRNIDAIPLRINVNGTRGKSTVTRLITGALAEAGKRTVGKTTGSAARLIFSDRDEEQPLIRRLEGPNIREQRLVVKQAAARGTEILVSECMAVLPDYQVAFQRHLLQANVGLITNVLEDHLLELGPTLDEIAEAYTVTIPYRGTLILAEGPYTDYFAEVARRRHTAVIVARSERVSADYLQQFDYLVLPEHVALALAVSDIVGIDEHIALRGMRHAHPDPYATRILPLGPAESPAYFVNGFAANDPTSTLAIWRHVVNTGYASPHLTAVINCRGDRFDRTKQFVRDVLPALPADTVAAIGQLTNPVVDAYEHGRLNCDRLLNLEGMSPDEVYAAVTEALEDRVIFGVGNIHGAGVPLVERLSERSRAYRATLGGARVRQ